MLTVRQHGPVTELRLTVTFLRQPAYSVSAYYFDGALIDTGPPRTGPELAHWARTADVDQIINTHQHEDHIGGNAYLPHIPARAPAATLPVIRTAPRIPFYRRVTFGQPRPAEAGILGESVCTRRHRLDVIPTPGHASDHVVLLLREKGWLFSADLYIMERARTVRRRDDVQLWLDSLRRILDYDFDVLFCSHAGYVPDGKDAIRRKIAYWERIGAEARRLAQQGYSLRSITRRLLGREGWLTYWSLGRFAKRNLVGQLLGRPPDAVEDGNWPVQGDATRIDK